MMCKIGLLEKIDIFGNLLMISITEKMSKYGENVVWKLTPAYNTHRGEVLDGTSISTTASVTWSVGKHCVDDDSTHYKIIKFLKSQPMNKASIKTINAYVAIPNIEHYLRELEKQRICLMA